MFQNVVIETFHTVFDISARIIAHELYDIKSMMLGRLSVSILPNFHITSILFTNTF